MNGVAWGTSYKKTNASAGNAGHFTVATIGSAAHTEALNCAANPAFFGA